MTLVPTILKASPEAGVPGGEVTLTCSDFDTSNFRNCKVLFGSTQGRIISASSNRVIVAIPEVASAEDRLAGIKLSTGGVESNQISFKVAEKVAENLHPVANPAFDRDTGNLYTTLSGSRGQKVPVSVWKISPLGEMTAFLSNVMNPTGIAFDREGTMFVSSRHDSTVYKISPFKEAEPFAKNLGIATGIAFDSKGFLYVGDRQGTIHKVSEYGDAKHFASLEPSVSAYHLAFSSDDHLYVTGPTASSYESIMKISPDGEVSRFYTGLGRPQGLAFDKEENLYVVASYQGRRGIVKINPKKEVEFVVSGNALVGLVFDDSGNMLIATGKEIYKIPLAIKGIL
ncbi:MAG: IPT/TIG domain-containing protein [Blastocatellia bacterium]|nr:IPT/TIG domain-containing protein [Blastocatellia bacterium]